MTTEPPKLSAGATFQVPGAHDTPASLLNRWSDSYVSLPAAVAVPHTDTDVVALVAYAKKRGLTIVVAGGKHLASVLITSKTLYMDMKNFDGALIDETVRTVTVGGAITTGAVIEALTPAGYYTSVPNTNAVGFVGAFLGGGSSIFNSVKGLLIDNAVAVRVVTSAGKVVTLGPESKGEEAMLWHALRGAGHGLAVVLDLTVRIYPIAELSMDDDKAWSRTTIFPPPAFRVAARVFAELQSVRGPIAINLITMRSPPGTPAPGSPIMVMSAMYFGPSVEAEKALSALLDPAVTSAAVMANTEFVPMTAINDGTKMAETRGGLKRSEATLLGSPVSSATIESSCSRFLKLCDDAPDAMGSAVVYYAFDKSVLAVNGASEESRRDFFEERDTGCIVYHDVWFKEGETSKVADAYLPEAIAIATESEKRPIRRFANFLRYPANLAETYSEGKVVEKKTAKEVWDPENVFWTPGC